MNFIFDPNLPGIKIELAANGAPIIPTDGFLGVFKAGTKLSLTLSASVLYTFFPKDQPQKALELGEDGNYHLDVAVQGDNRQVILSDNNYICLRTASKYYQVGFYSQNGRFFFVIEEAPNFPQPHPAKPGEVLDFSLLKGYGTVATKTVNAKIMWYAVRFDSTFGMKILLPGDVVSYGGPDIEWDGVYSYTIHNANLKRNLHKIPA